MVFLPFGLVIFTTIHSTHDHHHHSYSSSFNSTDDQSFLPSDTQQGIFDAVLKGKVDFDSDPWPLISESAKDLIRKMLCMQPSERLTAHDVLCGFVIIYNIPRVHAWFLFLIIC